MIRQNQEPQNPINSDIVQQQEPKKLNLISTTFNNSENSHIRLNSLDPTQQPSSNFIRDLLESKVLTQFQEAANNPIEDRWLASFIPFIGKNTILLAVFDGHGGESYASFAERSLVYNLQDQQIKQNKIDFSSALNQAIRKIELDQINTVRETYKMGFEEVAKVGTCLVAGIISKLDDEQHLSIANMGDCEICIVRRHAQDWKAQRLSNVQNANNSLERDRLQSEHPDESDIVLFKNDAFQVKGLLMPTRSLGDLRLKYECFATESDKLKFNLKQFPQILDDPELQSLVLEPSSDKYIVMASDGFWDQIAVEQIAGILSDNENIQDLTVSLKNELMKRVCNANHIDINQLNDIPLGRNLKRKQHDDITVIVLDLEKYYYL